MKKRLHLISAGFASFFFTVAFFSFCPFRIISGGKKEALPNASSESSLRFSSFRLDTLVSLPMLHTQEISKQWEAEKPKKGCYRSIESVTRTFRANVTFLKHLSRIEPKWLKKATTPRQKTVDKDTRQVGGRLFPFQPFFFVHNSINASLWAE